VYTYLKKTISKGYRKISETMPTYLWHQQAAQQDPRSILANRLHLYRRNITFPCKTDPSTSFNCCHSL